MRIPVRINDKHEYILNCDSVSKIVSEFCGIDYSDIPEDILKKAQDKGTCIHWQLENDIYECVCDIEVKNHIVWAQNIKNKLEQEGINLNEFEKEVSFYDDVYDFCGTIDLIKFEQNFAFIFDYKTSKQKHLESWECQLYLYEILADKCDRELKIIWAPSATKCEIIDFKWDIDYYEKLTNFLRERNEKKWQMNLK